MYIYIHHPGTSSNYTATANLNNSQIPQPWLCLFSPFCVFNNRSLATVSNSGDSSASRDHVVTDWRISGNWTGSPSLLSPPCRSQLTHSAGLETSLYSLGADPTENTASNSPSVVVMGGCLAMDLVLLTCLPAVTKQRMFLLANVAQQRHYMLQY
jgi:hypothetical protein